MKAKHLQNASDTSAQAQRSACPVAGALDLVGDRWTLLVLRDLLAGHTRFSEFARSPEGIPTNILTERLRRLETAGLLVRVPSATSSRTTYAATDAGRALRPTIMALAAWGNAHLDDTWEPPRDWLAAGSS